MLNRNRLYGLITTIAIFAYGWLYYLYYFSNNGTFATVCLFHSVSGLPCPSCGTGRSIIMIIEGHLTASVMTNPLGLFASVLLILLPAWVIVDFLRRNDSLFRHYRKAEELITSNKWIIVLLITLLLVNWIWNVLKV